MSATVKDLRHYRDGVQEALRRIDIDVCLQEEWNEPAGDVVELCRRRLRDSDGYFGVFGYRYGWVPSAEVVSITELECRQAFEHWKQEPPPIFVFLPKGEAAIELGGFADAALTEEHPNDEAKRRESRRQQTEFLDALRNGRFVKWFGTLPELRECAIAAVYHWNQRILKNAGQGRRSAPGHVPPADLGEIDRAEQVKALRNAILALDDRRDARAMCVIVHGGETTGHVEFLERLRTWEDWQISGAMIALTPEKDEFDAMSLMSTALSCLNPSRQAPAADMEALADAALARCTQERLVLSLSALHRLQGDLPAFHTGFWGPFVAAVKQKCARSTPPPNRITLVLDLRRPLAPPYPDYIWPGDLGAPDIDYDRLLPLPALGPFTRDDVEAWLEGLAQHWMTRLNLRRRRGIAARVTADDGTPLLVFSRLQADGFWSELAGGNAHA